jgi:predicted O-linked N-acetylglucosamine transferase (SPINDLY family)
MKTSPEVLRVALEHYQAGHLSQAEALYRQILQCEADNPEALHGLSLLALQAGQHERAISYIQRAIAANPQVAEFHSNLGDAYLAQDRIAEAVVHYRRALILRQDYAAAHNNLAVALRRQGNLEEAKAHFSQAITLSPDFAEAYNNLGLLLQDQGMLEAATVQYHKALALKPDYAEAHNNLGNALKARGHLQAAASQYQKALALKPNLAEGHNNLALCLQGEGRLEEAIASFQRALVLNPGLAEVFNNLGLALREQGDLEAAVAHYRQALALRPSFAAAYCNLGNAMMEKGELHDALAAYQEALKCRPAYAEVYSNLGAALSDQGKPVEAIAHYRQALALKPDLIETENKLMHQLQHLCEWFELDGLIDRQRQSLHAASSTQAPPFNLLAIPSSSADQLTCARKWVASRLTLVARLRDGLGFHFTRIAKRRLRIGYLSADFREHPIARLIAEVLERHDRAAVEVCAYSYGPDDGSDIRQRIARACDLFVDIRRNPFAEAARQIYEDGVDILVDLMGYTGSARTQILALRPAPIQVNYLGYPGTMGATFMDYIITDRFITPPDQQPYFAEKFVYLPDCYQANSRQHPMADTTPSRVDCDLPSEGFVFCCFNNTYKITPVIFDVWMRLLRAVQGSVLWLLEAHPGVTVNLRREAQVRGVEAECLVFAPRVAPKHHLARHGLADLFLDTLPYNAHVTCSDALWAGLPVLTCAGETFASRVAGSLLTAIGLPELITTSLADYEGRALRLAQHPEELATLRARIARNRLTAPLFDTPRFTRHLERAYELMWEIYAREEPPRQIQVPASRGQ